jgi:ubiquinone/menaquinone biosynthesis C-methylase UbiE
LGGNRPSERLSWAVGVLGVQRGDRILEIGCGHGVAVALMCEQLADGRGHVTAVDRSATMIAAAERRNADHVRAGRASFLTASLHDADLDDARFDKVLAVHVPVFLRGDPVRELEVVSRHLAPGGRLFLPFQPLHATGVRPTIERLAAVLTGHGYRVTGTPTADLASGPAGCVVATPRPSADDPGYCRTARSP